MLCTYARHLDKMAGWLRWWTVNPMCSVSVGSSLDFMFPFVGIGDHSVRAV
jgi:hypothetical protein